MIMHTTTTASNQGINRRYFLKSASVLAAAATAPMVLLRRLFGAGAPSRRITVAMIGCGRQSKAPNIPQLLKSEHAQVVAVCDVDSWRQTQAQQQVNSYYSKQKNSSYKGCEAISDFREILDRPDIDAVMISTPDHWHVPMAISAALAGKHVSLEKPMSTCIAHGRRLMKVLKEHPVITRNDSEFRTLPAFGQVAQVVRSGRLGKLQRIEVGVPLELNGAALPPQTTQPVPEELNYDLWLGPAFEAPYTETRVHAIKAYGRPGWMRVDSYCNGIICNWGAHLMGFAQWCNNSEYTGPVSIEGSGDFDKGLWNTLNRFEIRYGYANGVELLYKMERPYARFIGTDGWVEVEYPDKVKASSPDLLAKEKDTPDPAFRNLPSDKEDFLLAIKNNHKTLEPLETAHRTISMCQLGLISIQTGAKLSWNPDTESFTNNDNAATALLDRPIREKYFKFPA
jgi:myo-inositol 2-dehydrogenase/D-chiro-inositol 1-dehydrogenase